MKALFLGVVHAKGTSKQGAPYEMYKIHLASPIENMTSPNRTVVGHGFEEKKLDIDPLCFAQFQALNPPVEVDVMFEPKPTNFNQNWVVGLNQK